MEKKTRIITVSSGYGALLQGCEKGPEALKNYFTPSFSLYPNQTLETPFSKIIDLNQQVSNLVKQTLDAGDFPLVIGGDHSVGVGTWRGAAQYALSQGKPLGLIWLDAHMDANNLETSPSKAFHGMPVRALLDETHILLSQPSTRFLQPHHLCLIGVRSYDKGEMEFLKELKVKIYFMDEVERKGLQTVLKEAIELVNQDTVGYGVSLDVDCVEPEEAPGVGSPAPGGIRRKELLESLPLLHNDSRLLAFELVEFNPDFDRDNQTLQLCLNILNYLYKSERILT